MKAEGFMALTGEKVISDIEIPLGMGFIISLSHHYIQNGDLMRDREKCFIVVDKRGEEADYELIAIYQQMFQQDNIGIYEESIRIENSKVTGCIVLWQAAHALFANS